MGNRNSSKILWWLVLVLSCAHFCLAYFQNSQPFLDLDEYTRGASRLPYQYRTLMVWVVRAGLRIPWLAAISARLPEPIRDPHQLILFVTFAAEYFRFGPLYMALANPPNEG